MVVWYCKALYLEFISDQIIYEKACTLPSKNVTSLCNNLQTRIWPSVVTSKEINIKLENLYCQKFSQIKTSIFSAVNYKPEYCTLSELNLKSRLRESNESLKVCLYLHQYKKI